jgi:hypothetical protein
VLLSALLPGYLADSSTFGDLPDLELIALLVITALFGICDWYCFQLSKAITGGILWSGKKNLARANVKNTCLVVTVLFEMLL